MHRLCFGLGTSLSNILICGTLALDDIGTTDTSLSASQQNVKLTSVSRCYGGCALNIAYNLAGLSAALNMHTSIVPIAWAGAEYSEGYQQHVDRLSIDQQFLVRDLNNPMAKAIILTDASGEQFTAFYSADHTTADYIRALDSASVAHATASAVIIAPDTPRRMLACSERFPSAELRVWCPGQYTYALDHQTTEHLLDWSNLVILNHHEANILWPKQSVDIKLLEIDWLIRTAGSAPISLQEAIGSQLIEVPTVVEPKDPTGCGDAFTAAVVLSLLAGESAVTAIELGIEQAQRCLLKVGAQAH